jgi:hypothetical protein
MKGEVSLKLANEFDGMIDSIGGLRDSTTYCVLTSNSNGKYTHNNWLIFSDKPNSKFSFIDSIGRINNIGRGSIIPFMGKDYLYISEDGWQSLVTNKTCDTLLYAMDLSGNIKWKNNLNCTYASDIIEIFNKYILILSSSYELPEVSYLWKIDTDGKCIWMIQFNRITVKPVIDKEDNIYIKHGSNISKANADGVILWNIDLGSDRGCYWENIIYFEDVM